MTNPAATTNPIYVTRPTLPPLEEFLPYLESIWQSRILTNGGPFHEQLERELCEYLGVEHISLFANGTLALTVALQALGLEGEVITTPYSFVATAHALTWNRLTPVFVDIDPQTFNLDPARIEEAITSKTSAILPVHCYGTPCDFDAISRIARRHGLKVIYDAAHAFGVHVDNESVLRQGDLSVLSFHATKVFHTFEGGAVVCKNPELKVKLDRLKNFGFAGETSVIAPGTNGKLNEMQAAIGLLQLRGFSENRERRRALDARYREALRDIPGIQIPPVPFHVALNYAYFPLLVEPNYRLSRDSLWRLLRENGVYARRYFHPLISQFEVYRDLSSSGENAHRNATEVSERVLCLPIYPELSHDDQDRIVELVA